LLAIEFPLTTRRLRIRPFALADAQALHAVWADPANERFTTDYPAPATVAETREAIAALLAAEPNGPWAVVERATDALVGDCGLFPADGEIELAYGFRRDRWGRGYASEAAAACIRAGFEELGLTRIVADIHAGGNPASARVLAKLGFRPWRELAGKTIYLLESREAR